MGMNYWVRTVKRMELEYTFGKKSQDKNDGV